MQNHFKSFHLLSWILLLCMILVVPHLQTTSPVRAQDGTPAPTAQATSVVIGDLGKEMVATRPWRVAFLSNETEKMTPTYAWWQEVYKGLAQGTQDFGITMSYLYPDCNPDDANSDCVEAQIQVLADVLAKKNLDGIILRARDLSRLVPIVDKLQQAGIPVLSDEEINTDRVISKVGFDEVEMGKMLGTWVVKHAPEGATVVVLEGRPDDVPLRRVGILNGLKTGKVTLLDAANANWSDTDAYTITKNWLAKYSKIDVVMAHNDTMLKGAWKALVEAKRTDTILAWYGPNDELNALLKSGHPGALIDQQPVLFGRGMVQVMVRYLETKQPLPPKIAVPARVVSNENINDTTVAK